MAYNSYKLIPKAEKCFNRSSAKVGHEMYIFRQNHLIILLKIRHIYVLLIIIILIALSVKLDFTIILRKKLRLRDKLASFDSVALRLYLCIFGMDKEPGFA